MRSGWKSTVLALICGIFVGSQLNESVRVMDVYFATTSKLDAEYSDLPLEVQREPRSKNPAPRRMEEEPKSSVSGKEPTSHSSKAKGETAEMTSNSRKDGGSVLSNKLTSDTPPSLPIEENDQPKANDAIADEVAPEQPNVPIERKPLLKTTQKRGGAGESKRASSTTDPQKVPRSDNQTMNACLFIMVRIHSVRQVSNHPYRHSPAVPMKGRHNTTQRVASISLHRSSSWSPHYCY